MLLELRLEALATVESLAWEPGPGLNVVSGETGAGKSILVGAVALLFGSKAGAEVVRTGAKSASVEGRFDWSGAPGAAALLEAAGAADPADVVLRREIASDGRGRYHLNGRPLSAAHARDLGRAVMDLHGQHDHQSLLRPETHLELLDRSAGHADLVEAEAGAAAARAAARDALRRLEVESRADASRRELWEFQLKELNDAGLEAGEDEELERERLVLAHAERLVLALNEACGALEEDETGAQARLAAGRRALQHALEWDAGLAATLDTLEHAAVQLSDAARDLAHRAGSIEADPARLAEVEDRLQLLSRIKKRYGGSLDEAIALRDDLGWRLSAIDRPAETRERLSREAAEADSRWLRARRALHAARVEAADTLAKKLQREWREVGLPGARFQVALDAEPADAVDAGWPHRAEFLISTNPGEELRPLVKVASGGEISRLMLGLKSALMDADPVATLLFDEVDAGIGGRVADVVAQKLKSLARRHQVLCITHLPAIAAQADHHFGVEKSVRGGRTYTRVAPLDAKGRVEELARMLAGSKVTDVTRRQARELLG